MFDQLHCRKSRLAKWLLLVAVVFSVFTISGVSSSIQQKAHQTELFAATKVKEVQRQVRTAKPEFKNWTNAIMASSHLYKVSFNTSKRLSYGGRSICFTLHLLPLSRSLTVEDFMNV